MKMYALAEEKQDARLLRDNSEIADEDVVHHRYTRRRYNWTVILLAISNLILIATLALTNRSRFSSSSTTATDYADAATASATAAPPSLASTEIADALPFLQYEQRNFSGELAYNTTSKQLYRELDSSQPQYFGRPSAELDAAWHELMESEYIVMTEDEAAPFGDALGPMMGQKRME